MRYSNRYDNLRRIAAFALLIVCTLGVMFTIRYIGHANSVVQCQLTMTEIGSSTPQTYHFSSIEEAVASANASADPATTSTIKVTSNGTCIISDTIMIKKNISLEHDTDGNVITFERLTDVTMFMVHPGATFTAKNVVMDGKNKSNNLVYVKGGSFVLEGDKSKLSYCSNTNLKKPDYTDKKMDTNGIGTIYVDNQGSSNKGSFVMKAGWITDNNPYEGGGVYLNSGSMTMSGGEISDNRTLPSKGGAAGGIYLNSGVDLELSGTVKVHGNYDGGSKLVNVFYAVDGSGNVNGGIKLSKDNPVSADSIVGITSSVTPNGVSGTDLKSITDNGSADYVMNTDISVISKIFVPDLEGCEIIKDSNGRKLILRYGHTVKFVVSQDACEIQVYNTNVNYYDASNKKNAYVDVKHHTKIGNMPSVSPPDNFEAWIDDNGNKYDLNTYIEKSVTLHAKITDGKCTAPKISSTPEPRDTVSTSGITTVNVVLGDNQNYAIVNLSSTAGGIPATVYYTEGGIDPKATGVVPLTCGSGGIRVNPGPEDTVIRAYGHYAQGSSLYTDSDTETYKIHVVKVSSVEVTCADNIDKLYRGYSNNFKAKVTIAVEGSNTGTGVEWSVDGDAVLSAKTTITAGGVLSVGSDEKNTSIKVRATSKEDPTKYDEYVMAIGTKYVLKYDKNPPVNKTVTGNLDDVERDSSNPVVTVVANEGKTIIKCNGYTFLGWNTEKNGKGTSREPGETFTLTSDVTLYAQWVVNVNIDKVYISPGDNTVLQGASVKFTASVTGTPDTGTVTWELSGAKVIDNEDEKLNTRLVPGDDGKSATLYVSENEPPDTKNKLVITATSTENTAKWGRVNYTVQSLTRYSVTYNAAGGMGDMASFDAQYVAGTQVKVADNYFVRVGYNFVKWNTASSGRGTDYSPGEKFIPDTDVTLYAQWQKVSSTDEEGDIVSDDAIPSSDAPIVKSDKQLARECIALIEVNTKNGNIDDSAIIKEMASTLAAARAAYDALTDEQKALVGETEYQKLVMLEAIYNRKFPSGGNSNPSIEPVDPEIAEYALPAGSIFTLGKFRYKVSVSSDNNGKVYLYRPKSKNITSVTVPATVTYGRVTYKVTRVSNYAFKNCEKLKTFTCKNKATSIGFQALYSCNSLTKVKLGGNLKKIEDEAFMNCPKLSKVYMGGKVNSIGSYAFYKDKKLKAVEITTGTIKSIGYYAFNKIKYKAYIKMPDKYYSNYHKLLKNSAIAKNTRLKTY